MNLSSLAMENLQYTDGIHYKDNIERLKSLISK